MSSVKISPSILSADFSKLGNEIQELEKANADLIHIDVMDGHFVPNITIGPEVISKLRKYTSLPFDVHLMISPVDKFIPNFAEAGADIITIHPEATNNLSASIKKIKSLNKKAGVSLNPETSMHLLHTYVIPTIVYGLEAVNPTDRDMEPLEVQYRKILKQVFSMPDRVADVATYVLTG